ncbi:MAG TPA: heme lyase CcmF/NrfE family subunit [Caulobacteraceae bacterium]|nr:heme lyase CcmF/NrfE family subunit [Caulobacteraceae bacterium]
MIAELGSFALVLALALALAQSAFSVFARLRDSSALRGAGEGAAAAAFVATAIAFGALMWAFVHSDFSVMNVAQNSHTSKPLLYKITGVWGSHEGSMMLWCLALTGYGALVAVTGRTLPARMKSVVVASQGLLGAAFLAYTVFASNPFLRLADPPVEGRSLNPALQDPAFAFHPPMLYLGYVGCSIVFSFAIAALVEKRVDAAWARWVRPWALTAWGFLTLGITLGGFWAYYELGWGGWWAWDPVENASFMPWLITTALLHSAIVTEKRGAFPGWTVFLALAAFTFSMLGAFLVRSGVLMSVHSFAVDSKRGVLLLSILALAAGTGFGLFAWRAPKLPRGGLYSPISRETTLILNNIFLAAATFSVLGGTMAPLIVEAVTGKPISVGAPYFNLVFGVLMALMVLILPIGPLLAWKRGDAKGVFQRLLTAAGIAVLAAGAGLFLINPHSGLAIVGAALGMWLVAGAITELYTRVRGSGAKGELWRRLTGLPRGAWGTTLGHLGLGVFILGACIELAGKVEASNVMTPGDTLPLGAYTLRLNTVGDVDGPNYLATRANMTALRDGKTVCEPKPERRLYYVGERAKSQTALCPRGLDDVYVVMGEKRDLPGGKTGYLIKAYVNPFVRLIFLGPLIMAIGGAISLSDRRLRIGLARKARPKPPRQPEGAPA